MRAFLTSVNLGGYFDDQVDTERLTTNLIIPIKTVAVASGANLIVIHFQELGGKNKVVAGVPMIQDIFIDRFRKAGFWSSGILADLDSNGNDFTALGSIVFLEAKLAAQAKIFNFNTLSYMSAMKLDTMDDSTKFGSVCQHMRIAFGPKKTRKGFLHTKWLIPPFPKPVNLVNVHLIHDESNLVSAVNEFPSVYSIKRLRALNAILRFVQETDQDCMFLFGDFNFRLDLHRFVPWISLMQANHGAQLESFKFKTLQRSNGDICCRYLITELQENRQIETKNDTYSKYMLGPMAAMAKDLMPEETGEAAVVEALKARTKRRHLCCSLPGRRSSASKPRRSMAAQERPVDITNLGAEDLDMLTLVMAELDKGSGIVDTTQMRAYLKLKLDIELSEADVRHMVKDVDEKGWGMIDYVHFLADLSAKLKVRRMAKHVSGKGSLRPVTELDDESAMRSRSPSTTENTSSANNTTINSSPTKPSSSEDDSQQQHEVLEHNSNDEMAHSERLGGLGPSEPMGNSGDEQDDDEGGQNGEGEDLHGDLHQSLDEDLECPLPIQVTTVSRPQLVVRKGSKFEEKPMSYERNYSAASNGVDLEGSPSFPTRDHMDVNALEDTRQSIKVQDKLFTFNAANLLLESTTFCQLLQAGFDRELSLFNDCRLELQMEGMYEMAVEFPPTYPFAVTASGAGAYADTRAPGWCDRILMTRATKERVKMERDNGTHQWLGVEARELGLMGPPAGFRLHTKCGNFYGCLMPQQYVSDHLPVVMLVSLE
eukprot:c18969_g1_i5.p1 GENE.c18969_g1_i5~~c18969_g1_i5.p1  ORF type:complete len:768 (+),score=161.55 c18969_g1_i5:42-2345(+)